MKNGKHVILCVDDDSDILDFLKMVLEGANFVFLGASSGEEGLKLYKQAKPDLVIADRMMEEVDAGTSLVKDLKALGAAVPIFMLSSVGDQLHMSIDSSALGLNGVFQKPIEPDKLIATLKRTLAIK